jgi:hypothetical protein
MHIGFFGLGDYITESFEQQIEIRQLSLRDVTLNVRKDKFVELEKD